VPPPRWREAFPEAHVAAAADTETSGARVVWVHARQGEDCAARVRSASSGCPGAKIVVLAEIPRDDHAIGALGAGAHGYCNAYADARVLREIAEVVLRGGMWLGESLITRLISTLAPRSATSAAERADGLLASLTAREREIVELVLQGRSNKEIARETGLADRTVKAHLTTVFQKLGVRDRLQLALVCGRV
jgi:DNA-binding NarL/FixJ family response regulator